MMGGMENTNEPAELNRYSAAPRYNMQAVERATGLSPRTLRSWERRYGMPDPARDTVGRRLYSDRDVALIRWLTEQVQRGVSVGRAVAMLSEKGTGVDHGHPGPDMDRLQLQLLQSIDWMDEEEATRILSASLEAAPVDAVVLDLIQPVLYRVGDLWAAGRMSVASEHFGTNLLRSTLTDLLRRSHQPWRPHHILVGCGPGEMHDVGALVLALFLRHAGFRVTYLGANLEGETLSADLERIRPRAVCLSATTAGAASALVTLYTTISRTFHGILAYGGPAFSDNPDARSSMPGVFLSADVRVAVETLTTVLTDTEPLS